jgi:hypothetical protein
MRPKDSKLTLILRCIINHITYYFALTFNDVDEELFDTVPSVALPFNLEEEFCEANVELAAGA